VYSTYTRELISREGQKHISFCLVIIVGVGVELATPGSAVKFFTTEQNPLECCAIFPTLSMLYNHAVIAILG